MAPILRKALLLVLVGLFVCCFMLGCKNSGTTRTAAPTTSAGSTTTMETPSPAATEVKEQPKAWGDETRENIIKGE